MIQKNMTQSEINALLNDSDLESSALNNSQLESRVKQPSPQQVKKDDHNFEESNAYGDQQFEDFEESKKTSVINKNLRQPTQNKGEKSSVYDSYANEEFDSYEESRRTKEFEPSEQNVKFNKKPEAKQLKPIQEYTSSTKTGSQNRVTEKKSPNKSGEISHVPIPKPKNNNLIATSKQTSKPKSKSPLIASTDFNENKYLPYNYGRLQERQKELLMTTLSEQNKKMRQIIAEKDKELNSIKTKYNILLEQKAHVLVNAKQATLKKQLEQLQSKYDALVKEKTKQRAFKAVSMQISKTATNNFVTQAEAQEREQELMIIIQKLKERLVSTDKELKTLQQKMNEGLDYQDQLQRKLKRVEQLELRMEKMKIQADQDRVLIEMLKDKNKEQKIKMEELQQEKNELNLSLKRAELSQATQSDLKQELQQTRREKQLLQKSLKDLSMNFSSNLLNAKKKKAQIRILRYYRRLKRTSKLQKVKSIYFNQYLGKSAVLYQFYILLLQI